MHKGTLLVKQPGSIIPKEIWETAAKLYPTGWGVAVVEESEGTRNLVVQCVNGVDIKTIMDTQEAYKGDLMIFNVFSQDLEQDETEIDEADLQPFIPLFADEDEGDPLLVVFIEGPINTKWNKGEGFTPHYYFAKDYLKPNIERLLESEGMDTIEDLFMELSTNGEFHKTVLAEAGADVAVIFMGQNNKFFRLQAGDKSVLYPWGEISHNEGFSTPTVGTAPKKKGGLSKIGADSKLIPAQFTPAPATPDRGMVRIDIPRGLSRKERKQWIFKATKTTPANWQDLSHVTISYNTAKELGLLPKETKNVEDLGSKLGSYPEQAATNVVTGNQVAMPLMTKEDKEKAMAFFATVKMPDDPAKFKDMEEKHPNWSEQTGKNVEETFTYLFDDFKRMGNMSPQTLAVYAFTMRNLYMNLLSEKKAKEVTAEAPPKKAGLKKS